VDEGRLVPYLLLALALSVVGVAAVMLRNRRPSGTHVSIDDFERRLDALRPSAEPEAGRSDRRRREGRLRG